MEEAQKIEYRIDNKTVWLMIAVAIFFDIISLIPVANVAAVIFGGGTFGLWFYFKGLGLVSPKKIAVWGSNLLAESFLAVSTVWPGFMVGVIIMIIISRTEDKTGLSLPLSVGKRTGKRVRARAKSTLKRVRDPKRAAEVKRRVENIRRIREEKQKKGGSVGLKSPSSPHKPKS